MKKLLIVILLCLISINAEAITFSGGSVSTKTGTENTGKFLQDFSLEPTVHLVHDFQRIVSCGDYKYFTFMNPNLGFSTEWGNSLFRYNTITKKVDQYNSNTGGTNAKDDHNYYSINCDESDGQLYIWGGAHNTNTALSFKSDSPYDISAWTSIFKPTGADAMTYPRGCIESDGDFHTFWREGFSSWNKYLEHNVHNGTSWGTPDYLVQWEVDGTVLEGARIYHEQVCDGDDVHFIFSVRDGHESTGVPASFHYIVYFKYNMSTGVATKADGTTITLPVDKDDADKVETGNNFYPKGIGVHSTLGPLLVYVKDQDGESNWFQGNQQLYSAYYNSGWQKVDVTGTTTAAEQLSLVDPINTDTMYIVYTDNGVKKTATSSSLTSWASQTSYNKCNYVLEQNPDLTEPIFCVDGYWGDLAFEVYQVDLP